MTGAETCGRRRSTIESDEHLVTRRWTCEIPAEDNRIEASGSSRQINLSGHGALQLTEFGWPARRRSDPALRSPRRS